MTSKTSWARKSLTGIETIDVSTLGEISAGSISSIGAITTQQTVTNVTVGTSSPITLTNLQCNPTLITSLNSPSGSAGVIRGVQLPSLSSLAQFLPSTDINTVFRLQIILNFSTAIATGWPIFFDNANGNVFDSGGGNNVTNTLRSNIIYKRNPVMIEILCRITGTNSTSCLVNSAHMVDPYNMPLGARLWQNLSASTNWALDSASTSMTWIPNEIINRFITVASSSDTNITVAISWPSAVDLVNSHAPPFFQVTVIHQGARVTNGSAVNHTFNNNFGTGVSFLSAAGPPSVSSPTQIVISPTTTSGTQARRLYQFSAFNEGAAWRVVMLSV